MEIQTYCEYSGTSSEGILNCSTTLPYIENVTTTGAEFNLQGTWTYGEFFISFLLVFIIFFYFAGSIFKFFFENFIRIKRKND